MDGKADFDSIYGQEDPRAYYSALGELDYQVPVHGAAVFDAVLDTLPRAGDGATIVDVCCSYGINAAVLNHDVEFEEIVAHYTHEEAADLDRSALIERDRAFFEARRKTRRVNVVGVDASGAAIDYATDAGLLGAGVPADLESGSLDGAQAALVAEADLITVTGGVGYVGERTFRQLVDACDRPPMVAALTLRWVDYEPIAAMLDDCGLQTEHLPEWRVPQRRFADGDERDHAIDTLDHLDRDVTRWEENGWHAAELYLSRTPTAVDARPADELLAEFEGEPPRLSEAVEVADVVADGTA